MDAGRLSKMIVMHPEAFWKTSQNEGGRVHWVKINSAWKLVNKSQNKGRKDGSLDIDHGQTSTSREIFPSWELLRTLRSWWAERGEPATRSISVDDRDREREREKKKEAWQRDRWLVNSKVPRFTSYWKVRLVKCRYCNSLGLAWRLWSARGVCNLSPPNPHCHDWLSMSADVYLTRGRHPIKTKEVDFWMLGRVSREKVCIVSAQSWRFFSRVVAQSKQTFPLHSAEGHSSNGGVKKACLAAVFSSRSLLADSSAVVRHHYSPKYISKMKLVLAESFLRRSTFLIRINLCDSAGGEFRDNQLLILVGNHLTESKAKNKKKNEFPLYCLAHILYFNFHFSCQYFFGKICSPPPKKTSGDV